MSASASVSPAQASAIVEEEDAPVCWLCYGGEEAGALERPCACPGRVAHRACSSRWQLQQMGKKEERACRFCDEALPDWKTAHEQLPKAPPIMTVVYEGVAHSVTVSPGPEGEAAFMRDVRRIYGLKPTDEVSLSFGCKLPGGTGEVTLDGAASFDAAVHLASISAGERLARQAAAAAAALAAQPQASGGAAGSATAESSAAAAEPARRRWRLFS